MLESGWLPAPKPMRAAKMALELIQPDWPAPDNVRAFATTRKGGFSRARWSGLNLGDGCGDDPRHIIANRRVLRTYLPAEPCWLNQVHGKRVARHHAGCAVPGPEADAMISNAQGQVCAVLTADCLPVLLCHQSGRQVAAVHAGWRGLARGILEATVTAMDGGPGELMAWLGPAIGAQAYEVGQDVVTRFTALAAENSSAFSRHHERWLADLYLLARLALDRIGVKQVSGGRYCTYSEPDKFYSYRRDGTTGRMANVIWLAH